MRQSWNKGLTAETDPRIAASAVKIKASATGKAKTPEGEAARRAKISATAKARGTVGGYREGAGHSKKYKVLDSFGNEACLQSSHELTVAEYLNKNNIKWRREGCFFYDGRRYFPDFHLVESDVYLDVKNEYLIKVDEPKINRVRETNPELKLIVFTLKDLMGVSQQVEALGSDPR